MLHVIKEFAFDQLERSGAADEIRKGVAAVLGSAVPVAAVLTGHILNDPEQSTGDIANDEPNPAVDELLRQVRAALRD